MNFINEKLKNLNAVNATKIVVLPVGQAVIRKMVALLEHTICVEYHAWHTNSKCWRYSKVINSVEFI
jgi:hypothetical protein